MMPIGLPTGILVKPEPGATKLTYEQSAALMTDTVFRGRVKVAVLEFADKINTEPTTTPAHNSRFKWAQNSYMNPDMMAGQIQQPTVMTPQVQAAGSEVSDLELQAAVESVVESII
jgi:hypothetical protein